MTATVDKAVADLQRANAELQRQLGEYRAERDEAFAQQTATAEVLQVINASPGDLAPVFKAMVERAVRLCEADEAAVRTFDGELLHLVAAHGDPTVIDTLRQLGPSIPDGLYEPIARGERMTHIADVRETDPFHDNPRARERLKVRNIRSWLAVALCKEGALLGVINVHRHEVRPFSDKQVALLQNFAAQAVIAMENARLITQTREALEQQSATAEVLRVINSSPGDLIPVFNAMLEKAHSLCGIAQGSLELYDGERFRAIVVRGLSDTFADMLRQGYPASDNPATRPLLEGNRFTHIRDLAETEYSVTRSSVELDAARTLLCVPLRRDSTLLGMIACARKEVRPFSEKEIALLENFAAQAVIAIENVRLITETREALEQQTATAEVLQVINSSPGDLGPVFDAMLHKAASLCEAPLGTLWTFEGKAFQVVASLALTDLGRVQAEPNPNNVLGRLARDETTVHILDVTTDPAYRADSVARTRTLDTGARTVLGVPLRKDDMLIGAITVGRREVRPFTDKQIALLQNFAAQAVIAMENARLINETREALEQQTATAEVLQVINSSPGDLAPVFDAILEKAHSFCGATYGSLHTVDGEAFRAVAVRGMPETFADLIRRPFQPGPKHPVRQLIGGAPFSTVINSPDHDDPIIQSAYNLSGMRTALFVPLRKGNTVHGYIVASRPEVQPFTDKQIALLQNFAAQAVIAMENARLLGELRQRTEEVAELNRGLEARVAEQVEELGRVGRLKRFLAPQLAELIVSRGDEQILESHRREIVVVFCDLRGYTAFTETAEPEEVLDFLREYHGALGPLVSQFEGTLDQFSGDGIMVFFNDPVPCSDPAERAVEMAMAMRAAAGELIAAWHRHGCELGFGVGIAQGYATLGQIGFSERSGYTAIGTVCNLAARLCAEAKDEQILVSSRIAQAIAGLVKFDDLGNLELKGLRRPVAAFNVTELIERPNS